jgi:hypothetical protein
MPGGHPWGKTAVEKAWHAEPGSIPDARGRSVRSSHVAGRRTSKPLRAILAAIILSVGFWALLIHYL